MKNLIRIAIILGVMLVISAGYWFIVNQTSLLSSDEMPVLADGEMPERPEMDESTFSTDGTVMPDMPDHHEESSSRGFSELLTILVKIIVIATVIILLQVFIDRLTHRNKLNQITEQA